MQPEQFSPAHSHGSQRLGRFEEIDGWAVHDPGLRHSCLGRGDKILGPLRVVGIEQDDHLVLVIGRAKDAWMG
jgi:hypothetical protein